MTPLPAVAVTAEVAATALATLPGCGRHRLGALLAAGPAHVVWEALAEGRLLRLPGLAEALGRDAARWARRWQEAAAEVDVAALALALRAEGVGAVVLGGAGYPARLANDHEPPPLLFYRGLIEAVSTAPCVAIVGTRRCTGYGVDVARQLGRDLAAAGVTVVSGLALGIDGAAHEGALAVAGAGAPPVAVVGSGLDVVYPPRHRTLWRRVSEQGLVLSEAPLGAAPEAWRFPLRNRIIAGLADVVVVVESHAAGGSMSTVRAAADRDVPVMAVPGSVRSPSSAGTNRLIADGVAPAIDVADVLVALSLQGSVGDPRSEARVQREGTASESPDSVDPDGTAGAVLAAVDWTPTATEDVLRRTGLAIAEASATLTRLEIAGRVVRRPGGWWERAGEPR